MRKIYVLLLLMLTGIHSLFAQQEVRVELSQDNPHFSYDLPFCRLLFTMEEMETEGNANVSVSIHNTTRNGEVLLLFANEAYEKYLKKSRPSFLFDKKYAGNKGDRKVSPFYKSDRNWQIMQSDEEEVAKFVMSNDQPERIKMPVYVSKPKGKSNSSFVIYEEQQLELVVSVDIKKDTDYPRLEAACDALVKECENRTYIECKGYPYSYKPKGSKKYKTITKYHYPSVDEQKKPYQTRIEDLRDEIKGIISSHHWTETDKHYQKYDALLRKLKKIDLNVCTVKECTEKECITPSVEKCPTCKKTISKCPYGGNHPIPVEICPTCKKPKSKCPYYGNHPIPDEKCPTCKKPISKCPYRGNHPICSCGYCNTSLLSIYSQLDSYYKQIYAGKVKKAAVIGKVNALYRSAHNCKKRGPIGAYASKIDTVYNQINKCK